MKVLFAAAEAVPFAKTGGLGDVIGSLPQALQKRGLDVRVVMPLHKVVPAEYRQEMVELGTLIVPVSWRKQYCGLKSLKFKGVTFYFIENEQYFERDKLYGYGDDAERFSFFSRAVLEILPLIGFKPGAIHCNDWHTALVSLFLPAFYAQDPFYEGIKTVLTIHNISYQGVFSPVVLKDVLGLDEEYYVEEKLKFFEDINYLKGGIAFADLLTTVSKRYAEEILTPQFGEGLEQILMKKKSVLYGIVNGIDYRDYNPLTDPWLPVNYRSSRVKKQQNKCRLQLELGLQESIDTPLLAVISRLVEQKGIGLLLSVLPELLKMDVQVVALGTGEDNFEQQLGDLSGRFPQKMAVRIGFDEALARKIYAASDIFLMPSRTEPCGLGQIIALRYGSIPVVRETGGLKDTVSQFSTGRSRGNGFLFKEYDAAKFLETVKEAISLYKQKKEWDKIMQNALKSDFSWSNSAQEYHKLYQKLVR